MPSKKKQRAATSRSPGDFEGDAGSIDAASASSLGWGTFGEDATSKDDTVATAPADVRRPDASPSRRRRPSGPGGGSPTSPRQRRGVGALLFGAPPRSPTSNAPDGAFPALPPVSPEAVVRAREILDAPPDTAEAQAAKITLFAADEVSEPALTTPTRPAGGAPEEEKAEITEEEPSQSSSSSPAAGVFGALASMVGMGATTPALVDEEEQVAHEDDEDEKSPTGRSAMILAGGDAVVGTALVAATSREMQVSSDVLVDTGHEDFGTALAAGGPAVGGPAAAALTLGRPSDLQAMDMPETSEQAGYLPNTLDGAKGVTSDGGSPREIESPVPEGAVDQMHREGNLKGMPPPEAPLKEEEDDESEDDDRRRRILIAVICCCCLIIGGIVALIILLPLDDDESRSGIVPDEIDPSPQPSPTPAPTPTAMLGSGLTMAPTLLSTALPTSSSAPTTTRPTGTETSAPTVTSSPVTTSTGLPTSVPTVTRLPTSGPTSAPVVVASTGVPTIVATGAPVVAPPFTPTATITGGIVPFFGASLSFSADGSELAVGSFTDWNVFDATVDPLVWSARPSPAVRRLLRQLQATAGSLVSLSGEGSRVAVVDEGGSRMRIYQWSGTGFTRMGNVLTDFAAIVTSVALSADGLTVALGQAGNVEVFRFVAGANRWFPRGALTGASNVGSRLAFSDNGETLATPTSAEGDVTVFAWDKVDNQWFPLGEPIPGGNLTVGALSASSAGDRVAIGGGGTVRVYSNIDSAWTQEGSTMMGSESSFGSTLAMTGAGDTLIVGASDSDEFLSNAGEVRFYGNVEGDWALIADTTYGAGEDDRWGASVAISRNGRVVAISADQRDLVDFTGYVGIFEREI
jgi:hypothetical protein